MKNLSTPFAISLLLVISIACSEKSTEVKSQMDHGENEMIQDAASTPSFASTIAFQDESTTALFTSYLAMKDALVETDGEMVSAEAKQFARLLSYEKYNSIKSEVEKIAGSTDTKVQREAFDVLSEEMIALVKSSELTSGSLFIQHCPMVNGNKGANWLSLSEEIRNPYFGDKMLTCGEVREIL